MSTRSSARIRSKQKSDEAIAPTNTSPSPPPKKRAPRKTAVTKKKPVSRKGKKPTAAAKTLATKENDSDENESRSESENISTVIPTKRGRKIKQSEVKKRQPSASESSEDEEEKALAAAVRVRRPANKKQKSKKCAFSANFDIDSLLAFGKAEKDKKTELSLKLKQIKADAAENEKESTLSEHNAQMVSNMEEMNKDQHLFAPAATRKELTNEAFGYVFQPISEPMEITTFQNLPEHSNIRYLEHIYECLKDEKELSTLVLGKLAILRLLVEAKKQQKNVEFPKDVARWFFELMACHQDNALVRGVLTNFAIIFQMKNPKLNFDGLPAIYTNDIMFQDVCTKHIIEFNWKPTLNDFLQIFRKYGFKDSKRGMSAKNKMTTKESTPAKRSSSSDTAFIPFPVTNMEHILTFISLCLRMDDQIEMVGYDTFSLIMFFLRMFFEENLAPSLKEQGFVCVKDLLEKFKRREWKQEWAPLICRRIASRKEGIFDSAFSWLAIARSFPKTNRGSELSSMLSLYVLQYRIDVDVEDNVSPEPNSLPLSHTFVMDIIINNVDGMISHAKNNPTDYNLMSAKVSFMDIAMQAVSIELDGDTVDLVMGKLNKLTEMTRSTMVAKWHEVKTIVSLMQRKYGRPMKKQKQSEVTPIA